MHLVFLTYIMQLTLTGYVIVFPLFVSYILSHLPISYTAIRLIGVEALLKTTITDSSTSTSHHVHPSSNKLDLLSFDKLLSVAVQYSPAFLALVPPQDRTSNKSSSWNTKPPQEKEDFILTRWRAQQQEHDHDLTEEEADGTQKSPSLSIIWTATFSYPDEDGDLVEFSTDQEFNAAVQAQLATLKKQKLENNSKTLFFKCFVSIQKRRPGDYEYNTNTTTSTPAKKKVLLPAAASASPPRRSGRLIVAVAAANSSRKESGNMHKRANHNHSDVDSDSDTEITSSSSSDDDGTEASDMPPGLGPQSMVVLPVPVPVPAAIIVVSEEVARIQQENQTFMVSLAKQLEDINNIQWEKQNLMMLQPQQHTNNHSLSLSNTTANNTALEDLLSFKVQKAMQLAGVHVADVDDTSIAKLRQILQQEPYPDTHKYMHYVSVDHTFQQWSWSLVPRDFTLTQRTTCEILQDWMCPNDVDRILPLRYLQRHHMQYIPLQAQHSAARVLHMLEIPRMASQLVLLSPDDGSSGNPNLNPTNNNHNNNHSGKSNRRRSYGFPTVVANFEGKLRCLMGLFEMAIVALKQSQSSQSESQSELLWVMDHHHPTSRDEVASMYELVKMDIYATLTPGETTETANANANPEQEGEADHPQTRTDRWYRPLQPGAKQSLSELSWLTLYNYVNQSFLDRGETLRKREILKYSRDILKSEQERHKEAIRISINNSSQGDGDGDGDTQMTPSDAALLEHFKHEINDNNGNANIGIAAAVAPEGGHEEEEEEDGMNEVQVQVKDEGGNEGHMDMDGEGSMGSAADDDDDEGEDNSVSSAEVENDADADDAQDSEEAHSDADVDVDVDAPPPQKERKRGRSRSAVVDSTSQVVVVVTNQHNHNAHNNASIPVSLGDLTEQQQQAMAHAGVDPSNHHNHNVTTSTLTHDVMEEMSSNLLSISPYQDLYKYLHYCVFEDQVTHKWCVVPRDYSFVYDKTMTSLDMFVRWMCPDEDRRIAPLRWLKPSDLRYIKERKSTAFDYNGTYDAQNNPVPRQRQRKRKTGDGLEGQGQYLDNEKDTGPVQVPRKTHEAAMYTLRVYMGLFERELRQAAGTENGRWKDFPSKDEAEEMFHAVSSQVFGLLVDCPPKVVMMKFASSDTNTNTNANSTGTGTNIPREELTAYYAQQHWKKIANGICHRKGPNVPNKDWRKELTTYLSHFQPRVN
jgi:hypothetical protein